MTVIVESISGIFNLLKLGKVNSEKGNCELSLLYFAQAAHVFALVKNRSQEITCHKAIGLLHSRQSQHYEAAVAFETAIHLIFSSDDSSVSWQALSSDLLLEYAQLLRLLSVS